MENELKKLLVISGYAPPSNSGSGLMMYNILSQFPKNSLVILTSDNNQNTELQKYRLDAPYYYYGNNLLSLKFNENKKSYLQKLKMVIKNFPPTKLVAQIILFFYLPFKITRLGLKITKKEKIKSLLGYSDFGPNLLATYLLHKITKLPFSIHFYDMYQGNKMPILFKLLSKYLEPKIFAKAEKIFVMCDELKEYYEDKYHKKTEIIYNSIFIQQNELNAITTKSPNNFFDIIYLGSIYWAQENAVLNIVKAIEKINNIPIRLFLYTPHSEKYLNSIGINKSNKIFFSSCLPEQVQEVFKNADLLYLGLSFTSKYTKLINTSSPGKLCDYLVSARPILIHSPKKSFLTKYATLYNFAYVVDENDITKLKENIESIYLKHDKNEEKINNAIKIAFTNHNAVENAKKLINELGY